MSVILMQNRQDFGHNETVTLLPGLESELNDITKLTIKVAGNRTVTTLMRGTERWTVAERGNYPADMGKIRQTLISLAKATVVEEKTANPTLYSRLGVEDIANEDATGTELIIDGANNSYRIIIGKTGVRGDQAYVRIPDSTVSLLIAAKLNLGTQPTDWLGRAIIDIPSSDIFRVTTTHPDGETVIIEKTGPDASSFELTNQTADTKTANSGVTDSIGSALAELTFDDVSTRALASIGLEDIQPVVTRFETFDGLIIIAKTYINEEVSSVGLEFSDDPELATRFAAIDKEQAANKPATTRAAELNARLGKWFFKLPGYKLDQLTHHQPDLLN